jgi:large subunit ribosomal protein L4
MRVRTMKVKVTTLDSKAKKVTSTLADVGVRDQPRADIVARVVNWQLAKRRAGTHKVKSRGEMCPLRQPRCSARRAQVGPVPVRVLSVQFRGGGVVHGPVVRDHGHSLPKKVRQLGLKLGAVCQRQPGKLIIVDDAEVWRQDGGKTAALKAKLAKLGAENALFIGGAELDVNFVKAASNLPLCRCAAAAGDQCL